MSGTTDPVSQLDAVEFRRRMDTGERLVVLDVREVEERAICVIPIPDGCLDLHLPMQQIPGRLDDLIALAEATPLVIYCHHGMRSMTVARWLAARGVPNLANLLGGIDDYSASVDRGVPRY